MNSTTTQTIKRGKQTLVRRTPRSTTRASLSEHVGELFFTSGVIQRYSRRDGRTFACLVDVNCCTYDESFKPHDDRSYIGLDHLWYELTNSASIPPVGTLVSNLGTVIRYRRKDTTNSFAFRPLPTHTYQMGLHTLAVRVLRSLDDQASLSGVIMREVNRFMTEINEGFYYTLNSKKIRLSFGYGGRRAALADLQLLQRRLLKYSKQGRRDAIHRLIEIIIKQGELAVSGFAPN